MTRPFPVQFSLHASPDVLEISIAFRAALDVALEKNVAEVLTAFGRMGSVGGLSGESSNPALASLKLISRDFVLKRTQWIFGDVRIDPASLSILLNMIHYIHLEDAAVESVLIAWQGYRREMGISAIKFPKLWPQLSFQLEFGNMLGDGDIDVTVTFKEPQNENVLEQVVDAMSAWLLASHRGAYADESFNPSKTAIFLGPDVMTVSPDRIIWYIEVMRCNESAFDGLINLLEWVHWHVARISIVEVGP